MKIHRKSQGMPVNVIIIAVLALIVLVVLSTLFAGRVKIFSQSLESCSAKQGRCTDKCEPYEALVGNAKCPENKNDDPKNDKCCVQVLKQT